MEQNNELLPPPQPMEVDSAPESMTKSMTPKIPATEHRNGMLPLVQSREMNSAPQLITKSMALQTPEIAQYPMISPPQQTSEIQSPPRSTTKSKVFTTRADWVNTLWADISGQFRRFSVISNDLFDGLLLKRDTVTGSWILRELRNKYEELRNDRTLATVKVLPPEERMGDMWQLLWTIKRHRDPSGRRFHSMTAIEPINHRTHLELEANPGQIHSVACFSLSPFIQDYGPGPSEFDLQPEDDFDAMIRDIVTEVDAGRWVGKISNIDGSMEQPWL